MTINLETQTNLIPRILHNLEEYTPQGLKKQVSNLVLAQADWETEQLRNELILIALKQLNWDELFQNFLELTSDFFSDCESGPAAAGGQSQGLGSE